MNSSNYRLNWENLYLNLQKQKKAIKSTTTKRSQITISMRFPNVLSVIEPLRQSSL